MGIILSNEQNNVLNDAIQDLIYYKGIVTIGGYAGTGKTTMIAEIAKAVRHYKIAYRIAFCAFTGKAADVLRRKIEHITQSKDTCSTIHKLMYFPEYGWDSKRNVKIVIGWEKKQEIKCDLIIIDEASMVSKEMIDDLKSYKIPIIAIGDSGQLPPVGSKFNLMDNPKHKLITIHRQALNNPIIGLSQYIREYGCIPMGQYKGAGNVIKMRLKNPIAQKFLNSVDYSNKGLITLCGVNATRVLQNRRIRKLLGYDVIEPYPGERVINLNNDYDLGIFNGQIGDVSWFSRGNSRSTIVLTVQFDGCDDEYVELYVLQKSFDRVNHDEIFDIVSSTKGQMLLNGTKHNSFAIMDFGYCVTVHKSQGSEWDKLILFEEGKYIWSNNEDGYARWLYTAVTRAKESVFIVTDEE